VTTHKGVCIKYRYSDQIIEQNIYHYTFMFFKILEVEFINFSFVVYLASSCYCYKNSHHSTTIIINYQGLPLHCPHGTWGQKELAHMWHRHRQQPTRLPHPWGSPGKNTGVGCHFLLQCMKVKSESEVAQSCPTLSDPMDCSLPGSSVHGSFQARVLEWGVIAFSKSLLDIKIY